MTLNPRLAEVIGELHGSDASSFEAMTPKEARAAVMEMTKLQGPPAAMAAVSDHVVSDVDGLRVRVYRPHGLQTPAPTVLFFHGGGWTVGDIEFADSPVRALAAASTAVWVSGNYRLAPEHPYPCGLDDAWTTLGWVTERVRELGGDPQRVIIAGESSGGNLCAALALRARDRGGPALAHQYLLFPPLGVNFESDSYRAYGEGLLLTRAAMEWFWGNYVGADLAAAPAAAAPLKASSLRGLAPATIVVADNDALRDDGVAYAERLRAAGVPVNLIEWAGMTHGAFQMSGVVPRVATLIEELGWLIGRTAPVASVPVSAS